MDGRAKFLFRLLLKISRSTIRAAGIAQSVYRLAKGWTTEGLEFESRYGKEFSFLHVVQTGSGANPASYQMGTGGLFPRSKAAEA
jgi:hypothetical protein